MKPPWLNRQRKYQKQQSIIISTILMVRFSWFAALSQLTEIFRDQVRLNLVLDCRRKMETVTDFSLERTNEKLLCQLHIHTRETSSYEQLIVIDSSRQQEIMNELHLSPEKLLLIQMPKTSHPVCTSESFMSSDTKVKSLAYCRNISTFLNV